MFERFTERARQVVTFAMESAAEFGHDFCGSEHILIGICREKESLAAKVLAELKFTEEEAVEGTLAATPRAKSITEAQQKTQIPFTPRAKKVLELALREALGLGHNYIGTEHILLGLVRENEGVANKMLSQKDIDGEKVRNAVIAWLSGGSPTTKGMPRGRPERTAGLEPRSPILEQMTRIAEAVELAAACAIFPHLDEPERTRVKAKLLQRL